MSKVNIMLRHIVTALLISAVLLLTACVTTKSGGVGEKADQSKALETSLQLARNYISLGNWDQAKRHLQYVESVNKNNPETLETLAVVFQNTGELETAEEYYKRSIQAAPNVMRTRNNYAVFLYDLGRYEEAAAQLEIVAQDLLYERRVEAFLNLGRCYVKLDKYAEAEATFRRAFLMDRTNPGVVLALANIYFQLDEFAESQRYFQAYESIETKPSASALWLGIRLADTFDDKNARASYALALKNLFPKSEEYLLYKAYIEQDSGNSR